MFHAPWGAFYCTLLVLKPQIPLGRPGLAEIKVEVREGMRADAEEFAVLDNATHGTPYTRAETIADLSACVPAYP